MEIGIDELSFASSLEPPRRWLLPGPALRDTVATGGVERESCSTPHAAFGRDDAVQAGVFGQSHLHPFTMDGLLLVASKGCSSYPEDTSEGRSMRPPDHTEPLVGWLRCRHWDRWCGPGTAKVVASERWPASSTSTAAR